MELWVFPLRKHILIVLAIAVLILYVHKLKRYTIRLKCVKCCEVKGSMEAGEKVQQHLSLSRCTGKALIGESILTEI